MACAATEYLWDKVGGALLTGAPLAYLRDKVGVGAVMPGWRGADGRRCA